MYCIVADYRYIFLLNLFVHHIRISNNSVKRSLAIENMKCTSFQVCSEKNMSSLDPRTYIYIRSGILNTKQLA